MKAIGYTAAQFGLPIDDAGALTEFTLPEPAPRGRDLLVEVRAVSVNPVDTKVRRGTKPEAGETKVLGWDAVGIVRAVAAVLRAAPEAVIDGKDVPITEPCELHGPFPTQDSDVPSLPVRQANVVWTIQSSVI